MNFDKFERHTPGPWKAKENTIEGGVCLVRSTIAVVTNFQDIGYDNRSLIEAAPELLSKLKAVQAVVEDYALPAGPVVTKAHHKVLKIKEILGDEL